MLLRETFTNQLHIYNAKLYQMRANASKKSKCRRLHICRLSMCLYIFLINFEPFSNQRHKLKENWFSRYVHALLFLELSFIVATIFTFQI